MINQIKEKKSGKVILEIAFVILVLIVFSLLLFKYYGKEIKDRENSRFVNVDYKQLQKEADAIGNPGSLINESAKNIFVLNYHLVTKGAPSDQYEISYDQFKANMFALKSQGYQTVNLEDFYLFMKGEKQLPDKSFVLTFDDGAKASYYNVDPTLKALNYTAVMFVITGDSLDGVQRAYYLNESEIYQAQLTGRWELESHTDKSHIRVFIGPNGEIGDALTNKLWLKNENRLETKEEYFLRVSEDLKKAKNLLESTLNKTVIGFSLPFGNFAQPNTNYPEAHDTLYNLTTQMHKLVFYQFSSAKSPYFRANYNDIKAESYVVVRLSVDSLRTPDQLLNEIEASRALTLPYFEDHNNINRWPTISGQISMDNDRITLKNSSNGDADIRFAYLDGSYLWKDYTYSLQLREITANKISLISRLRSSTDYALCRYEPGLIKIINVNKNLQTKIKEGKLTENLTEGTTLSMSVSGLNVKCLMNGKEVLSSEVQNLSDYGAIGIKAEGFKSEDKTFAFSNMTVVEETPGGLS